MHNTNRSILASKAGSNIWCCEIPQLLCILMNIKLARNPNIIPTHWEFHWLKIHTHHHGLWSGPSTILKFICCGSKKKYCEKVMAWNPPICSWCDVMCCRNLNTADEWITVGYILAKASRVHLNSSKAFL